MEYVSRTPQPPLDELIDDLYYFEGTPPYAQLMLPPAPGCCSSSTSECRFRIRARRTGWPAPHALPQPCLRSIPPN